MMKEQYNITREVNLEKNEKLKKKFIMIVSKQIKFSILVWLRVGEREFLLWKSCYGLSWGLGFYQQKFSVFKKLPLVNDLNFINGVNGKLAKTIHVKGTVITELTGLTGQNTHALVNGALQY